MHFPMIAGLIALLTGGTVADAQGVPAPASTDQPTKPTVPANPTRAKKPATLHAPSAVIVVNASTQTAVMVIITAEDATATTPKPLGPKARTTLKLPKLQGCTVLVAASFQSGVKLTLASSTFVRIKRSGSQTDVQGLLK
jgi:hypothetical protein